MRPLIFLIMLLCSPLALSHQLSTAYLQGEISAQGLLKGQLQVRLYDLERAIGLDADADGQLRWQELLNRQDAVVDYLQQNLILSREQPCELSLSSPSNGWLIDQHFNEGYVVMPLQAQCPLRGDLNIHYSAFFSEDSQHKLLVEIQAGATHNSRVMADDARELTIVLAQTNRWATFKAYVYQGMLHIWIGADHILFLLSLLLISVLVRADGKWQGERNGWRVLRKAGGIVTAFTLAHSITLTLTALGWLTLPSRWVEVGIAASVAFAAANNIVYFIRRIGPMTLAFGLLHGMGFAGALGELGLRADNRLLTILAFNLGVEIGQLVILASALPLLFSFRQSVWYSRYLLNGTSVVIVFVATQWVIARV